MGAKDLTEKILEAYNDVFADIVNGLLFAGEPVIQEQMLEDAQPVSAIKADGKMREQDRDVAKYWIAESEARIRVRLAFLGIENQTEYDKDMPLRVIGYDGAAYRAELGQKDRYPVLTLVLYFGDKAWGRNHSLYDAIAVPERMKPYVSNYRINVFEIAHLPEEQIACFHSDFKIVVDYFIHRRQDPDYRPRDPQRFQHADELLKLMTALTNDHRFADALTGEGEKPNNMCEVLDRVEARGEARGRIIGTVQTYNRMGVSPADIIKNIMREFDLNQKTAEEYVEEILGIRIG